MKVVIVNGRGIEGCGVTKFSIEMQTWFKKIGHEAVILAPSDKSWSRKKAHELNDVVHVKFAKEPDTVRNTLASADLIVINSIPSLSHPEACTKVFIEELQRASETTKVYFFQLDHNKLSMRRNVGTKEMLDISMKVFALSPTGDFAVQVSELYNEVTLDSFFGVEKKIIDIIPYQITIDFERVRKQYWQDISTHNTMIARWIGRTTFWKGFVPMFNLHNNHLKNAGFVTVLEGIEKSPAYLDFKTKSPFIDKTDVKAENIDDFDPMDYAGQDALVFGPYNNHDMLLRMAKTGFGFQLSAMKDRFIYQALEYTHCEIICTGTTSVFRKSYGDACSHTVTGKKLTDHSFEESGTLWLDDDNLHEVAQQIIEIKDNPVARDKARNAAFEFYRQHQDASFVFPKCFGDIL